tara:strand:+ start:893 stop:1057 length:165 start_codon:yes stop_codon:yes gene_type:complete
VLNIAIKPRPKTPFIRIGVLVSAMWANRLRLKSKIFAVSHNADPTRTLVMAALI